MVSSKFSDHLFFQSIRTVQGSGNPEFYILSSITGISLVVATLRKWHCVVYSTSLPRSVFTAHGAERRKPTVLIPHALKIYESPSVDLNGRQGAVDGEGRACSYYMMGWPHCQMTGHTIRTASINNQHPVLLFEPPHLPLIYYDNC